MLNYTTIQGPYVSATGDVAHVYDDAYSVRVDRFDDGRLEVVIVELATGTALEYEQEPLGPEDYELTEQQSTAELALEALKGAATTFRLWGQECQAA